MVQITSFKISSTFLKHGTTIIEVIEDTEFDV